MLVIIFKYNNFEFQMKKKFVDPNIINKSKTVEEKIQLFKFNGKMLPLPTEIEISESGTCNRTCSFCPRSAKDFVDKKGGKRTIQKILVANNGMAATKAIMSMRQWAYNNLGDERAIEFVAMATRDDLNANAEFIRLADTFVEVPSGSNKVI